MKDGVRLSDYMEWFLLKSMVGWIRRGEMTKAAERTRKLARLSRRILKTEWFWTQTNLDLVYGPNLPREARETLARRVFEEMFLSYLEAIRPLEVNFSFEGMEHLEAVRNRGFLIASIHLGSWEPALCCLSRQLGLPLSIVYRHANNPLSEAIFQEIRAVFESQWIRRRDVRDSVRAVRDGRVLCLMTDINTRKGGVPAPFFGIPALSPMGPSRLAIQYGLPLLPVVAIRQEPGHSILWFGEPIEPGTVREYSEEGLSLLTGRINQAFEPVIHKYTEQYNWMHARFRGRPGGGLWRLGEDVEGWHGERIAPYAMPSERIRGMLGLGP